jgi:arylsulfatase A-like enzyme
LNLLPGDICELYNLDDDPLELTNLYGDPAQIARVRDLTSRIQAWQQRTGDNLKLPVI